MNCKQIDINMLQKPEALTHAHQQAKIVSNKGARNWLGGVFCCQQITIISRTLERVPEVPTGKTKAVQTVKEIYYFV